MLIIVLAVLDCGDEGIDDCPLRQRISHRGSYERAYRVSCEPLVYRVLETASEHARVISRDACDFLASWTRLVMP